MSSNGSVNGSKRVMLAMMGLLLRVNRFINLCLPSRRVLIDIKRVARAVDEDQPGAGVTGAK